LEKLGKPTDRQECERVEWKTSEQGGHGSRAVNVVKVATGQQQHWLLCCVVFPLGPSLCGQQKMWKNR